MLMKRIVAILKRFRPSKRGEFASVSPLLAITPIVAHFKPAKLRWRFISRPGAGRQPRKGRRLRIDSASVAANESEPLPGKMSLLLFSLSVVLTALLAVAYITLAEATPAKAATVPIQTCGGTVGSGSINTDGNWSYSPADAGPSNVFHGQIPANSAALHLGLQRISVSITSPKWQKIEVTRIVYDTVTNTNYDPNIPGSTPTIDVPRTERKDKWVQVPNVRWASKSYTFASALVRPATPGAPDTNRNLTSQTTRLRANINGPTANFNGFSVSQFNTGWTTSGPAAHAVIGFGSPSYSYSSSVGAAGGTRKSDGAGTSSSPPNYYDQGTIEAWSWSAGWSLTARGSVSLYYTNHIVIPDTSWDGGSGTVVSFIDSSTLSQSSSVSGSVGGCSRTLVVKPPTCTPKLRTHPDNGSWSVAHLPATTETFDPYVEHGGGGQTISVFPVGPDSRTHLVLRNRKNLFELASSGSLFSYSVASPYNSGRWPSVFGRGTLHDAADAVMGSELNGAGWSSVTSPTLEPSNAINFPGHYRVTWRPSWSSRGSSAGWSGSELSGSVCEYEPSPRTPVDTTEGPQPHPTNGSVVSSLILNVHVYADPPTCTVGNFLFEVNEPIVPKVTLSNPNRAPMWVDVADSNISRLGFSQTDVSGFAGQAVPAGGDLVIDPTVPSINHSGEFVLNWTIQTNMGTETWTTLGTPRWPLGAQRSWFQDPEERIVDSTASACEVTISKVVYRPFIKVFYGGLAAGGQFGTSHLYSACGKDFDGALGGSRTVAAFVAGHTEGSGPADARGSSAEYTLQAFSAIGGFYSASQRASPPIPFKGLTLANNGGDVFGGNFAQKACIAHYWREVERLDETTKPSPLTLDIKAELGSNERRRYEKLSAGEKLELTASAPLDDLKATLYVEGDVYIKEDLINNGGRWHDPSEIGYLSIIAKGNIYIDPAVEQIDALLVAYPKLDSANNVVDGRIRTCWYAGIDASKTHFNTCDKQLVINGALIAEKILFGRVFASVKQETVYPAAPTTTRAAEVINLLPEYLIGSPELPLFSDQIYKTDSFLNKPSNF